MPTSKTAAALSSCRPASYATTSARRDVGGGYLWALARTELSGAVRSRVWARLNRRRSCGAVQGARARTGWQGKAQANALCLALGTHRPSGNQPSTRAGQPHTSSQPKVSWRGRAAPPPLPAARALAGAGGPTAALRRGLRAGAWLGVGSLRCCCVLLVARPRNRRVWAFRRWPNGGQPPRAAGAPAPTPLAILGRTCRLILSVHINRLLFMQGHRLAGHVPPRALDSPSRAAVSAIGVKSLSKMRGLALLAVAALAVAVDASLPPRAAVLDAGARALAQFQNTSEFSHESCDWVRRGGAGDASGSVGCGVVGTGRGGSSGVGLLLEGRPRRERQGADAVVARAHARARTRARWAPSPTILPCWAPPARPPARPRRSCTARSRSA
jgi:hypothetical protein